jgi:hypothetical protein
MTIDRIRRRRAGSRAARAFALLVAAASLAACDNLLKVNNPNQLKQEDIENATSATAVVNGALATVSSGYSASLLAQAAASDELKWVGSYDSGRDLYLGNLTNARNEFVMSAFPSMSQGRWMSDLAIHLLEDFDTQNVLKNRDDLVRAYIYGGLAYVSIADMWDDFALSDRQTAAPPLGDTGMLGLYDTAIGYLDKAVTLAQTTKNSALELTAIALRARTKHAKAVRTLVTPKGKAVTNPLVNDAGANADAQLFFSKTTDEAWRYRLNYSATSIANTVGAWVNERREFRPSDVYVVPDATDKQVGSIRLTDPITDEADPALSTIIDEFKGARQYGPLTVVSARELHLILAEAALAASNTSSAVDEINTVRALDGLPDYDPAVQTSITPREMLIHERQANLFMTGRRLLDMYRFGIQSPSWLTTADAVRLPGILLPIADSERQANCYIAGTC